MQEEQGDDGGFDTGKRLAVLTGMTTAATDN